MTAETWAGSAARRVRIYISEDDSVRNRPAWQSILGFLRRSNAAGVSVYRGVEGFGASGRVHSSRIAEVPWNLPVIIEWIDTPERTQELLPVLRELVPAGLITIDPTEVVLSAPRTIRTVSDQVPVSSVMTKDVVTVSRQTPIAQVIVLLREHSLRSVPVIDEGLVVGMITSSDLVKRAGLGVRLTLLPGLSPEAQARQVQQVPSAVAEQIMSAPAVVVSAAAPLSEAAKLMAQRRLKRLPVIDERGALIGIVSRLDLLRTVMDFGEREDRAVAPTGLNADRPLATVMREDVSTLYPDSTLSEVVQAVVSTRLNRALVVDTDRHVLGVVTARAVLERVTPALHPNMLTALMHRLPFLRAAPEQMESERHSQARTARELMTKVQKARASDRLRTVIRAMVEGAEKLVAVVDEQDRLVGVVDRADVLRGMLEDSGPSQSR